jgi:CPA2 family monovalent cation:H+ antiporter-2
VTIAAGLGLAFVFALIASRLRLPPMLGYILAGLALGPFTPGLAADPGIARQLSEIGVTLLMFGVGLHFSIRDLWAVRRFAVPGSIAKIAVAVLMGMLLARAWGWTWGAGLIFGLCLAVASTVVFLRAMNERGQLETVDGRLGVGWLIVEDLVVILALVAVPALAAPLGGTPSAADPDANVYATLAFTVLKVGVFVAGMLVLGKKLLPMLLGRVARTGSRELFTLGVVAIALGIAFGASELFGVSPALGAFFAGVVISESDLSHRAGAEILPLQETFTVLFFVAIGMMFDPAVLVEHPWHIVGALGIVLVGKPLATVLIMLVSRFPIDASLLVAAGLAQVGEFSFILVSLGVNLGVVPNEALSIVLAASIFSIAVNPAIFRSLEMWRRWMARHRHIKAILEAKAIREELRLAEHQGHLQDHVVMIGYGRVGATIGRALAMRDIPFVVVDLDRSVVEEVKRQGVPTVFGDASRPGILRHAGLESARLMVIATPAKAQAREMVEIARSLNSDIEICVRTHTAADSIFFEQLGIQRVVLGELELALEMAEFALTSYIVPREEAEQIVEELREIGPESLMRPPI